MPRVQVAVRRIEEERRPHILIASLILCVTVFIVACWFTKGAYEALREDYMIRLDKERTSLAEQAQLKTELYALTRTRLAEYQAREKLGLRKAPEKEVLVVR